ncbi:hypothetical protein GOP47_0009930 [Adiantum capillus-veneris]|uniref:Uncharacterized protein n=1 Tax=Adiantum capillus-veneris TaxID=13818 RepID=A0A9D4UXS0_ADICA|nr:hypothetical protein GOP47_0009930 [Adiantum capillus-veneris]
MFGTSLCLSLDGLMLHLGKPIREYNRAWHSQTLVDVGLDIDETKTDSPSNLPLQCRTAVAWKIRPPPPPPPPPPLCLLHPQPRHPTIEGNQASLIPRHFCMWPASPIEPRILLHVAL